MSSKPFNLQQWMVKHRLILWWAVYIPLVIIVLFVYRQQLGLEDECLNNLVISPLYKIFNSNLMIILARVVLIAVGAVVILICLFFPLFRVSREGVHWTKELEEELAEASGEITGEEISGLVKEESFRWSLIYGWLKQEEKENPSPAFLLRELLATVWEAFPHNRISLYYKSTGQTWGLLHPLLVKLILTETGNMLEEETTFGLKLRFSKDTQIIMHIYSESVGFSQIDEKFILVLGEVFLREAKRQGYSPDELLTYFDRVMLTSDTGIV